MYLQKFFMGSAILTFCSFLCSLALHVDARFVGPLVPFVAQGALAQAVQEHREWVKFNNMTQEHGPALPREFFVLFLISLPSFQPWIPEPEFALLAAESELGLSWGASCGILQILQLEYHNSSRSLT